MGRITSSHSLRKGQAAGSYNLIVLISEFDYRLPSKLIAQEPLPQREASRMLRLSRETGKLEDRCFRDFPELLCPGDLVVFNNTRVFPARLYGRRSGEKTPPHTSPKPSYHCLPKGPIE